MELKRHLFEKNIWIQILIKILVLSVIKGDNKTKLYNRSKDINIDLDIDKDISNVKKQVYRHIIRYRERHREKQRNI